MFARQPSLIVTNLVKSYGRSSGGSRSRYSLMNRGGLLWEKDKYDSGIYFLFPEVPRNSTPETNHLLASLERKEVPDFAHLTREDCGAALLKLALDYESSVWSIEEKIKSSQEPNLEHLKELELASNQFETVWNLLNMLYICKGEEFVSAQGFKNLTERARTARSRRFNNETIYYSCKELSSNKNIRPPVRRVLEKYVLEGKLSGMELTGKSKEHFIQNAQELEMKRQEYRENLSEATSRFKHLVVDQKYMGEMPNSILKGFAKDKAQPNKLPWIVTLEPSLYHNFLKYCPERALRWNTWSAYVSRSTGTMDKNISNSPIVEDIRQKRKNEAKILGFDNYVQLSMMTKMAGKIENVQSMIATLLHHALPAQKQELAQLQSFAETRAFDYELQQWDVEFYRRKQAKALFSVDQDEALAEYFSYPTVLNYLIRLCSHLFSIEIIEVPDAKTWHPEVSFFKVLENGQEVGSFLLDPYERKGKRRFSSWLFPNQSRSFGLNPFATLVLNFPQPLYGKPSLLNFNQVEILFQKFGSLLQHLLTKVDWKEVNGQNNIEWDSVQVPEYFLSLWLRSEETISELAIHWDTGERLPEEKVQLFLKAKQHFAGYDLSQELYKSALDIEIYSSTDFWRDIIKSLYPKYNILPMDKADSTLCSFPEIFSGTHAAAYYSSLWSKMLAADIYKAFLENKHSQKEYGKRFRESYLALGGSQHPGEIFRLIRGRDPSPDSLLWVHGLDKYGPPKQEKLKSTKEGEPIPEIEIVAAENPLPDQSIEEKKVKKRSL